MSVPCTVEEELDVDGHEFKILAIDAADTNWMESLAREYVKLRTECRVPPRPISVDGITTLSTDAVLKRLKAATIPVRRADNFDVVRSDFGELISYELLEQRYGARIGYKSVRDRELINSPGRGIDVIGIEDGEQLTLVLGETKVSDDKRSPPGVVDIADDGLAEQFKYHLEQHAITGQKLWNMSRHIDDADLRDLYMAAALLVEDGHFDKLTVIGFGVLVRSHAKCKATDFGSFRATPDAYRPAHIRFLVVRLPDSVEAVVSAWYEVVKKVEVAA